MCKETPKDKEMQGYYCASILDMALKRAGDKNAVDLTEAGNITKMW